MKPQLDFLKTNTPCDMVKAGDVIFLDGQPGKTMFYLEEGEVEIVFRGVLIRIVTPGELFGEMAIVRDEPRLGTAIATADSKLRVIDEARFSHLFYALPGFAENLALLLSEGLTDNDEVPLSLA